MELILILDQRHPFIQQLLHHFSLDISYFDRVHTGIAGVEVIGFVHLSSNGIGDKLADLEGICFHSHSSQGGIEFGSIMPERISYFGNVLWYTFLVSKLEGELAVLEVKEHNM